MGFNASALYNKLRNAALTQADNMGNNAQNDYNKAQAAYNNMQNLKQAQKSLSFNDDTTYGREKLASLENSAPKAYNSAYTADINKLYKDYGSHTAGNFSYNINTDPLYKQYAQMYKRNAEEAQKESAANAETRTGGFGSTYAQTAAGLAYNKVMESLNDEVPKLYEQAYARYKDDSTNIYNRLNYLMKLDNAEYGKYRDNVSDYFDFLDYYSKKYKDERDFSYKQFSDEWERYEKSIDNEYNAASDYNKSGDSLLKNSYEGYNTAASEKLKSELQSYEDEQKRELEKLKAENTLSAQDNKYQNDAALQILKNNFTSQSAKSTSGTSEEEAKKEPAESDSTESDSTESDDNRRDYDKKQGAITRALAKIRYIKGKLGSVDTVRAMEYILPSAIKYDFTRDEVLSYVRDAGIDEKEAMEYYDSMTEGN